MAGRRPRASRKLRDTIDRVLIHDIKNMGFRLEMLRSNLEEHYGEPDFKRSVQELLASTVDRLDRIVGRWSAHEDAVLIKVALDVNGLIRDVAAAPGRRTGRDAGRGALSLALGQVPPVWGDPYYLRDALASLIDNALEAAAGPSAKVLVRSFPTGGAKRGRANIEIIDNGPGMSPEFVRDRLFQPFQTTKPDGVGLGVFTASQIVRHHRGTIRVRSAPGEGTVVRVSFPAVRPEP
ncbi:MAG TPA: ATP-binding protein [Thermoanaerobaculia bacterium]|nr:ATP-binding protein [Thermoanaerobaculia bacterium]